MADFTFTTNDKPTHEQMVPLYTAILSGTAKPTVSLGAVTKTAAIAWLAAQHTLYASVIGDKRSGLIRNMRIADRVDLVDTVDP
jgi:hypothetical protein